MALEEQNAEPYELDAESRRHGNPLYWLFVLASVGIVIAVLRYYDLDRHVGKLVMAAVAVVVSLLYYGGRAILKRRRGDEW